MKLTLATVLATAIAPALAIPPPSFGFPEAPNDTALEVAYRQDSGSVGYVPVTEGALFGINVPEHRPALGVNTTAYQSLSNFSGDYVVMMVDPDASYPETPSNRFILHWLQANMSQSTNLTVNANLTLTGRHLVNTSDAFVPYRRPAPPTNSSAHRYIIYAFQQPANFAIPAQWSGLSASNRSHFNLTNFIRDTRLGTPAAANFFYCSNQTTVPQNFTAAAGGAYPSGNGDIVTSGDPYKPTAAASSTGSGAAGATSASSSAMGAKITGVGGLVGAGLIGLAALM